MTREKAALGVATAISLDGETPASILLAGWLVGGIIVLTVLDLALTWGGRGRRAA